MYKKNRLYVRALTGVLIRMSNSTKEADHNLNQDLQPVAHNCRIEIIEVKGMTKRIGQRSLPILMVWSKT